MVKKNFYLSVYDDIARGLNPSRICERLGLSKQALNWYIQTLKRSGFIQKIGYGTWEILKHFDQKEVKVSYSGRSQNYIRGIMPKTFTSLVRSHGLAFRLKLPRRIFWARRQGFLRKRGVDTVEVKNGYFKGVFRSKKVHFCMRSVLVYGISDFYGSSAAVGKEKAVVEFLGIVKDLERVLGTSFKIGMSHKFRVFRQHYGNVNNELAKDYVSRNKRLVVYDDGKGWLNIDDSRSKDGSFALKEFEGVDSVRGVSDMDDVVIPFFNSLRKHEGYTPDFVLKGFVNLIEDRQFFAENQRTHIGYLKQMGEETHKLGEIVNRLVNIVEGLQSKPKKFGQLSLNDF